MQSFRQNRAYRLSLYLLVLVPTFFGLAFLLSDIIRGIFTFAFLISIPLLFLVALLLRFLSSDLSKHWNDILFITPAGGIMVALIMYTEYSCRAFIPGTPDAIYYQKLPMTMVESAPMMELMFDPCSPLFNIFDIFFIISYILFFTGLVLTIKLLISDIKRKRAVSGTIIN